MWFPRFPPTFSASSGFHQVTVHWTTIEFSQFLKRSYSFFAATYICPWLPGCTGNCGDFKEPVFQIYLLNYFNFPMSTSKHIPFRMPLAHSNGILSHLFISNIWSKFCAQLIRHQNDNVMYICRMKSVSGTMTSVDCLISLMAWHVLLSLSKRYRK